MEEVMGILSELYRKKYRRDLWYRLYADDLVVILYETECFLFTELLLMVSNQFGLIVSKKKSVFVPIKCNFGKSDINGFKILKEYNYLGVIIDGKGSVNS